MRRLLCVSAALLALVAVLTPQADARHWPPHRRRHARATATHRVAASPSIWRFPARAPLSALTQLPAGGAQAPATAPAGATAPPGGPVTTTDPTPVPAPAPPTPPAATALGVQEHESPTYTTVLSRTAVPAGRVTVQLQDTGEDAHDLRILRTDGTGDPVDLPLTQPGATTTRTVDLAPGTYRLFCTLTSPSSHDMAGMHATLTVTAP